MTTDELDEIAEKRSDEAAGRASARCSFQLAYARARVVRRLGPGFISGPPIPCANGSDVDASGDWEDEIDGLTCRTEAEWVDAYARYALEEGVHEVLEWFWVDGKPWLDTHGAAAELIHKAVDRLWADLVQIRRAAEGVRI